MDGKIKGSKNGSIEGCQYKSRLKGWETWIKRAGEEFRMRAAKRLYNVVIYTKKFFSFLPDRSEGAERTDSSPIQETKSPGILNF